MTFFAGHNGVVQLRRSTQRLSIATQIEPDDVNTTLNRFSFEGSENELLNGDFITISTDDPRGIAFLPPSFWSWTGTTVPLGKAGFYTNINALGGIRAFRQFAQAINNDRDNELALQSFSGAPLPVDIVVEDTDFNPLGKVTGYTLNTEREAVETTSLNDKFRQQYSAGLISGNGSIDALFGFDTTGRDETSLLMLQLIQRIETGSSFEASLFLTTENAYGSDLDVWYQFQAVVTKAGVETRSDGIISCAIDFLTTGEIRLKVGKAPSYVLQENLGKINLSDFSVDALLKEIDD
jgi:hypothetical protein